MDKNTQETRMKTVFKEKVFETRDSLITTKLKNNDFWAFYSTIVTLAVGIFMHNVYYFYIKTGELHIGQRMIIKHFRNLHYAVCCWCISNISVYFCYLCFIFWATKRSKLSPKFLKLWDRFWIFLILLYFVLQVTIATKAKFHFQLGTASALFYLTDHVRLLMKTYSFIRTNAPKIIHYEENPDKKLPLPKFWNLAYFIFAPVMIYRDNYPRSKEVHWKCICENLFNILLCIIFTGSVLETYTEKYYFDFCLRKYTWGEVVLPILENVPVSSVILCFVFYVVLHGVQNIFAELLHFGDRHFYDDWWTVDTIVGYYRKWNLLVSDWLFEYCYKDIYQHIIPNPKITGIITIFVSAVVHEWILTVGLELFFPIMFVQFFVIFTLLSLVGIFKMRITNSIVLYFIVLGVSIFTAFYCIEYYARKHCLLPNNTLLDFFKPRLLFCNCFA